VILAMPLGVWANLTAKMLTLGIGAGETSGTTATLVVVDGLTVTVASVGDSRCIVDTNGGEVSLLTVDHRLEENVEERERVTASGGEVGRLNLCGGQEVMLYLEIGMKWGRIQVCRCMLWERFWMRTLLSIVAMFFTGGSSTMLARWIMPFKIDWGY
jgi:hypothetical protein